MGGYLQVNIHSDETKAKYIKTKIDLLDDQFFFFFFQPIFKQFLPVKEEKAARNKQIIFLKKEKPSTKICLEKLQQPAPISTITLN